MSDGSCESWARLQLGDARNLANLLPERKCLDCTITSPPYGPTIDYGVANQIGHGQSYTEYLADMQGVFSVLHERTRKSGSLWLVVDSFKERQRKRGVPGKLRLLPFDLAAQAEEAGWTLQDVIIWEKDRTLPWNHKGQLRNEFEYVLFLVKTDGFKYHLHRIKEVGRSKDWWVNYPERYSPLGAAPSNVWRFPIPVQGSWSGALLEHRCPLPSELVARIIDLATDTGDVVCDPFAGIGTVLATAASKQRTFIGVELVPTFVEQFYAELLPEALRSSGGKGNSDKTARENFGRTVAALRHAKLPKVLMRQLVRRGWPVMGARVQANIEESTPEQPFSVGSQEMDIFVRSRGRARLVEAECKTLLSQRPLSKYGIAVRVRVRHSSEWTRPRNSKGWSQVSLVLASMPEALNGQRVAPSLAEPPILINIDASELATSLKIGRELASRRS